MKCCSEPIVYRYRIVSEHSINELLNDEVVISSLDTFNDPCDTKFGYESIDYSKELVSLSEAPKVFGQFLGKDYFNDEKQKQFLKVYNDLRFSSFISNFKKHILIGCFTLIPNNPVMWSHYCENRKGFVLAYDTDLINKLVNKTDDSKCLIEVDYNDNTFMVTDDIKNCLNSNTQFGDGNITIDLPRAQDMFNSIMLSKPHEYQMAFATKSKEWEYEHEVRLIKYIPESKGSIHMSIGKCVPKYIILGDKMNKKDRYLLLSIAKNKKIAVYELYASFNNSKYGLVLRNVSNTSVEFYLKNGFYDFELDSFDDPFNR